MSGAVPVAGVVRVSLVFAVAANVIANLKFPALLEAVPVNRARSVGGHRCDDAAAAAGLDDHAETFKGTIFLLALVTNASFMPVEELPARVVAERLGLASLSSVFDNIPLTALALKQGGYDWGFLAYTVGFGGSMIWFGSSAGVAISNLYPEAKSVGPLAAARMVCRRIVCPGILRDARCGRLGNPTLRTKSRLK